MVLRPGRRRGAVTDVERDALRTKILADTQRMHDALAPFYLGKHCPKLDRECLGTRCQWFLPMAGLDGKIAQAACAAPLLASIAGPIADALLQVAMVGQQNTPRIIAPAGLVKG